MNTDSFSSSIFFSLKNKQLVFQIVIKISDKFHQIINTNSHDRIYSLFFDSAALPIYDRAHIKRCQKIGHYHSQCRAGHPTCGFSCDNDHESKDCTTVMFNLINVSTVLH